MSEDQLREQLYASFKNRALIYWSIYDELCNELDADRAEHILSRAIRRRGEQMGATLAEFGPDDTRGLCEAFLEKIPDGGQMFGPRVERCDRDGLDIVFQRCPLRDAWLEAGLDDAQVATICRIAAAVDVGLFEGAGFQFHADTWEAERDGCCHLHIRPGTTQQGCTTQES